MTFFETLKYCLHPVTNREFWVFMGRNDIKYKYKRSVLGPFWLTLTNAVYIAMLAFIFGVLLRTEDPIYTAWVTIGVLMWNFITTLMRETASVYYDRKGFLLQSENLTPPMLIFWVIWRNILILLHQLPIILIVLLLFHQLPSVIDIVFLCAGIILMIATLIPVTMILALITARLRDMEPLVTTALTALFFVTPIMWLPEMIGELSWVVSYNPFSYLLAVVREPLLGMPFDPNVWIITSMMMLCAWTICILIYQKYLKRLLYWI